MDISCGSVTILEKQKQDPLRVESVSVLPCMLFWALFVACFCCCCWRTKVNACVDLLNLWLSEKIS